MRPQERARVVLDMDRSAHLLVAWMAEPRRRPPSSGFVRATPLPARCQDPPPAEATLSVDKPPSRRKTP